MSFLPRVAILLIGVSSAFAQNLPWYIQNVYPAPGSAGVPTNASILLSQLAYYDAQYSLTAAGGTKTSLSPNIRYTYVSLTPPAKLLPSTVHTLTIAPLNGGDVPYSFSFTTGAGPDTTPPKFLGFNPPSGTSGVGFSGPFTAVFDKPLGLPSFQLNGATIRDSTGFTSQLNASLSPDGKGIQLERLAGGYPLALQVTVDPTQVTDLAGNKGTDQPQTAHYTTIAATNLNGPVMRGFFPADGQTNIPTNVSIRMLFDQPMDVTTAPAGIRLTSGGSAVALSFTTFASGAGIAMSLAAPLQPNQVYSVSVSSSLLNTTGQPLQQGSTIQFTTGAGIDGLRPQIEFTPQGPQLATNSVFGFRLNKPIVPLGTVEYTSLGGPGNPPAVASLSADGRTFSIAPSIALLQGQNYGVNLADLVDFTGAQIYNSELSWIPNAPEDDSLPAVLAVTPPDGSTGIATNAPIQVLLSKVMGLPSIDGFAQILSGGQPVACQVLVNGSQIAITPKVNLAPNASYTIELSGIADQQGHPLPASSMAFSTGSGVNTPQPVPFLSSTPQNGAQNVDVNTTIMLRFGSPLSPLAPFNSVTVSDSARATYPVAATLSGTTLTITPAHSLAQRAYITVTVSTTDVAGNYAFASVSFSTGANPDVTSFAVTSVDPPDGSTLSGPAPAITLTFNKPVNPDTLTGNGLTFYAGGAAYVATAMRTNNDSSVVLKPSIPAPSAPITLLAGSPLTDLAGNPLSPFRASYSLGQAPTTSNTLLEIRPHSGSTGVPANATMAWFFAQSVTLASVQATLTVIANGQPVAGTFAVSPDGLIVTFQPSSAFPAGAIIATYQATPFYSDFYNNSFTVATPTLQPFTILRFTPSGNAVAANSVLEFEFASGISTGQGLITLHQGNGSGPLIAVTESIPRPHVLRLTPLSPLPQGYVFGILSPKVFLAPVGQQLFFTVGPEVTPAAGAPILAPAPNSTSVPLNASVSVLFPNKMDALSITPANVSITAGGNTLLSNIYISGDSTGIVLTPFAPLPPNANVTVTMNGVVDFYGNSLAAQSWTFTTGGGADFTPATVVDSSIPFTQASLATIPPNASLVVRFNKPIDPQSVRVSFGSDVPITTQFGGDLRTITLSPNPEFPRGRQINPFFSAFSDITQLFVNGLTSLNFSVAFDADQTLPQLLHATPADGQTGLPLNAQIIADFDKTLEPSSFSGVTLAQAGNPVPITLQFDDLHHIRYAPVQPLLPSTTYTLTIQGVSDLSGNQMVAPVSQTFTTGAQVDTTGPSFQILTSGTTNGVMEVSFSEPVSSATVDTQNIALSKTSVASLAGVGSYYLLPVPISVSLSPDGLLATITPVSPLLPEWTYQVAVKGIRDFAGNSYQIGASVNTSQFVTSEVPDRTAPVVVLTPPDGSTSVPTNTRIEANISKQVQPQPGVTLFQLSSNGQPVPGTLQVSYGTSFTFSPAQPLSPSTTYRIDFGSVTDLSGNVKPAASSTFTTGPGPAASSSFVFKSSNPANGDVGVPVNSPIVMTFSNPVDPATANSLNFSMGSSFPVTGTLTTTGNTVTFTPSTPYPSAASVSVFINAGARANFGLLDLVGDRLLSGYSVFSFTTVATPVGGTPQIVSIAPQPGSTLTPPQATFRLTFSEPVSPGSGLTLFGGTQQINISPGFDATDFNTIVFTPNIPANSQVTLFGSAAMTGNTGNPVAPFSYQWQTGNAILLSPPAVTSINPTQQATGVDPSSPVTIQFNKPMDPFSLLGSIRVTQDGENFTGSIGVGNYGQTATFTPSQPYSSGARIDVFVLETAQDPSGWPMGQRFSSDFFVAGTSAPTVVTAESFGDIVSPEASQEIAFNRPLDPKTVTAVNVWLRSVRRAIPGSVQLRGDRIVRFTPAAAMESGALLGLTVGPGLRSVDGASVRPQEFFFRVDEESPASEIETIDVVPEMNKSAVRVAMTSPISPLSIDRIQLIARDGSEIAAERRISVDHRQVWLIPDLARDLSDVSVRLVGVEDRTGRLMPQQTRKVK